MVGRKPTPTRIKELQGNPGHRPLRNEPKPKVEKPSCPPELSKGARKEWRRIINVLVNLQLVSQLDRAALAAYCQSYGRWMEAERKISETSLVIKTKSGNVIENPYYSISKRERELLHKLGADFGLTPAARTRLDIAAPATKGPNPFAMLRMQPDEFDEFMARKPK